MRATGESMFGDFKASEVIRALNKGRKFFHDSQYRIAISKEKDPEPYYSAICLEMNVVATGYTQKEAIENLIATMAFHVEDYIENGVENKILSPAPPDVWELFSKARRVSKRYIPRSPNKRVPLKYQARNYGAAFATS